MKEEYKTCPYCHNMVDKKDKQCPYCLKSLTRRNTGWNYISHTINNSINQQLEAEINSTGSDTIRDDAQQKKNWELPPLFQKFLDLQKAWKAWDKEARKKVIKYIIIFYLIIQFIPVIIETIRWFFWE